MCSLSDLFLTHDPVNCYIIPKPNPFITHKHQHKASLAESFSCKIIESPSCEMNHSVYNNGTRTAGYIRKSVCLASWVLWRSTYLGPSDILWLSFSQKMLFERGWLLWGWASAVVRFHWSGGASYWHWMPAHAFPSKITLVNSEKLFSLFLPRPHRLNVRSH